MDLVTPGFGLVFWTVITFLILFFLLRKFAWKPILNSVHTREESIKNALASAEAAKREMENLQADNERILQEARMERETLLKEARDMKNKIINDARDEAKVVADKLIAQAQEAIESNKKSAIAELKNQVAALSLDIAEKVVKNELSDKSKQEKLVEEMLDKATLN